MYGELYLYQAALGVLKSKEKELLGNPLSHILNVFKLVKSGEGVDEVTLFEAIGSVKVPQEEFEEMKEVQLMA